MPRNEENLLQSMSRFIESGIDPLSRQTELWDRYGETVAVLVLDSSGFSRVTQSHGIIHFLSCLMLLRNIAKPILEAHNCNRLHFSADNISAVFDSVDNAVSSARELHEKVYESKLMLTESERFRVSIGIGYGKMLYSETLEGHFSEEMNFASKLGEDLASGDETLLTLSAYTKAQKHLVHDFKPQQVDIAGLTLKHYRDLFIPVC